MIYNLGDSPIYSTIVVNGNLTFLNTTDQHLRCKILFIRAGELHIGSSDYPYTKKATITLRAEANKNDTQILIDPDLDLVPGDRLALLPTSYDYSTRDVVYV
jgi:hypothetical protein